MQSAAICFLRPRKLAIHAHHKVADRKSPSIRHHEQCRARPTAIAPKQEHRHRHTHTDTHTRTHTHTHVFDLFFFVVRRTAADPIREIEVKDAGKNSERKKKELYTCVYIYIYVYRVQKEIKKKGNGSGSNYDLWHIFAYVCMHLCMYVCIASKYASN